MATNSLFGAQKIALQFTTLLFYMSCILVIISFFAINNYNIKIKKDENKFNDRYVFVDVYVSIDSKILGNVRVFRDIYCGYGFDLFDKKQDPQKEYKEKWEIGRSGTYEGEVRSALYTQENLNCLIEYALKFYKENCYSFIAFIVILTFLIYRVRKWLNRIFLNSK